MNILIVGAGGVGSAVASIIETRSFYKKVILADFDASVSQAALGALDDSSRFQAVQVDAKSRTELLRLMRETEANVVLNACDPRLNQSIFDSACEA